jgi:small-conductance mechanosensitive channel
MISQKTSAPILSTSPNHSLNDLGSRIAGYQQVMIEWITGNWFEVVVATAIAVLIFLALSWAKRFAARVARKTEHRAAFTSIIARTLARTSKFFRIMVAAELVNGYAGAPHPVSRTIEVLFTIAVVVQVAIWLREIILGLIERRASADGEEHETLATAMVLIRMLVSFAVFAIAAIVILDNLGINVTGLVAGLGVGGIAIGLAAQGIFSDLFAAISVIFDKPFKRGDTVQYDTTTARVEKIGMKSTRLRALSGEEKIISNSKLLEKEITNLTALPFRRTTFLLTLVYHTPRAKLAALPDQLQKVVEENDGTFVRAGLTNFGASSIDMQLIFDVETSDYNEVFAGRHNIALAVLALLEQEQVEIAYPTQTTYTAAPDGTLIMPYASPLAKPSPRSSKT